MDLTVEEEEKVAAVDSSSRAAAAARTENYKTTEGAEKAAIVGSSSTAGTEPGEKKTKKGKDKVAPEGSSSTTAASVAGDGRRKTKIVRMSQSQIDLFLSYNPKPLDPHPLFAEIDAEINMWEKELLDEKEWIQTSEGVQ
ncbi:hypothetical protein ACP70R_012694 [Stipagrostis hirtigluma subsp. patula]